MLDAGQAVHVGRHFSLVTQAGRESPASNIGGWRCGRRHEIRFWLPTLMAIAVLPVGAHHPFTPYYDASKPASISGPIVELRMVNRHAVLP